MIPDLDTLITGPFLWLQFAAALAATVRGFAGFGAAMLFVPIVAAAYDPLSAVAILFVTDSVVAFPLFWKAVRICAWREVGWLSAGAAVTVPVGLWLLLTTDPVILRWGFSIAILAALVPMFLGWRYRGAPGRGLALSVGGMSGLAGGASSLFGPPVLLFWMSGESEAAVIRANVIVFLFMAGIVSGSGLALTGSFTQERLLLTVMVLPTYAFFCAVGARGFRRSSEGFFRRLALALCALTALATMPVWSSL